MNIVIILLIVLLIMMTILVQAMICCKLHIHYGTREPKDNFDIIRLYFLPYAIYTIYKGTSK